MESTGADFTKHLRSDFDLFGPEKDHEVGSVSSWLCDISIKECILALKRQISEQRCSIYTVYAFMNGYTTWAKIMTCWILQILFPTVYVYFILQENYIMVAHYDYCPGLDLEDWEGKKIFLKITGFLVGLCLFFLVMNAYSNLGYNWNFQLYVHGYKIAKPYHPDPTKQSLYIASQRAHHSFAPLLRKRTSGMVDLVLKQFSIWVLSVSGLISLYFCNAVETMILHAFCFTFLLQIDERIVSTPELRALESMCDDMIQQLFNNDPTMTTFQQSLIIKWYWRVQRFLWFLLKNVLFCIPFYIGVCHE